MIAVSILQIAGLCLLTGLLVLFALYMYAMSVAKKTYKSLRAGVPRSLVHQYLEDIIAEGDLAEAEKITRILAQDPGQERVKLPQANYRISVRVAKRDGSRLPRLVAKYIAINKKGCNPRYGKWIAWNNQ